jgi:transmembrane sensor
MSAERFESRRVSSAARAEAAAWVARLHGPNRTREVEAGLRRWLADDPEHRTALELLTETWERSARLRRRPIEQVASWELVGFRLSLSRAVLATLAVAVIAVLGTIYSLHSGVVSTGVGELRTLTLSDGTRVQMDSGTRLIVRYAKRLRQVELEKGEAFFRVAKNPDRPFVVTADGRQVRALGTQFDVLAMGQELAVTLIEGKVTVTPMRPPHGSPAAASVRSPAARAQSAGRQAYTLTPGERLTFAATGTARIDRPSLYLVTAWERGQVVLDNTTLADAVAQMNRYSRTRIIISDPKVGAIRLSGVFQAGESASFAAAVARTYYLKTTTYSGGDIVLAASGGGQ